MPKSKPPADKPAKADHNVVVEFTPVESHKTPTGWVVTTIPNGTAPLRYHGYTIDPNPGLEAGYYKDAGWSLSRKYPNVGDLMLAVFAKLVGVPQVRDFSLLYDGSTGRTTLWVWDHKGHPTALGQLRPIDDRDEWAGTSQSRRGYSEPLVTHPKPGAVPAGAILGHATPPKPVPAAAGEKPPQNARQGAKKPAREEEPFREAEVRHGVPVTVSKGGAKGRLKIKFWDYPFTAVLRWMGAAGWTTRQARAVMDALITEIRVPSDTLKSQVSAGRAGNGAHGDVPELDAVQGATLDGIAGRTPPPKPKGKNEKKMKKRQRG